MESQQPIDLPREAVSNHDELMSSFFAQPDALAYGKTLVDLIQEGAPEPLRESSCLCILLLCSLYRVVSLFHQLLAFAYSVFFSPFMSVVLVRAQVSTWW